MFQAYRKSKCGDSESCGWVCRDTLQPYEVKLAETTLATIRVGRSHHSGRPRQKPMRVIADKAYDSDPLRARLRQRGIELIYPHKRLHRFMSALATRVVMQSCRSVDILTRSG